jgi:hypothetical protein
MEAMVQVLDSLELARQAAARHAWREAHEAYSSVDRQDLTPDDLESFADAAWWTGKLDEAIRLREDSYAGFAAAGNKHRAARLALTLSWDHSGRDAFAVSHGWFANAERLLEGEPRSVEHGFLMLTRAVNALWGGGNLSDAVADFDRASEVGREFRDRDMQVLALAGKARALVKMGEVEQGLALLDEAAASAVCGELRPRVLHHDQLLSGTRRLPACRRMDRGGEPVVRSARRQRLPRGVPDPPRGDHAPARGLARSRETGARGVRGAP